MGTIQTENYPFVIRKLEKLENVKNKKKKNKYRVNYIK
jgi:hypothetical protein